MTCKNRLPCLALVAVLALSSTAVASAQDASTSPIWEEIAQPELAAPAQPGEPSQARYFTLDRAALDALLERLTRDARGEVPLPLPDGVETFRVSPSPVMAPALAARFPDIRAFEGRQVDDPLVTVRFDVSSEGLFGRVFWPDATAILAEAVTAETTAAGAEKSVYSSAWLEEYAPPQRRRCKVESDRQALPESFAPVPPIESGHELHTYRLAIAITGELAAQNGGTVERVLRRVVRTVNTLNEIYERDVAVRFQLVPETDRLIFTDPDSDPFDNDDAEKLLEQAQDAMDCIVGDSSYDVGHVLATHENSQAIGPGAGISGYKGMGTTGLGTASRLGEDPFDVDFVAHEIGHQFSAGHTWNGAAGDCEPANHAPQSAFEPGSGSTIMGYAGLCGEDDLQDFTDAYFHAASIAEILAHVRGAHGGRQPAPVPTRNQPPTVEAKDEVLVPKETPFFLGAEGKDPDEDRVTYCWEQLDLGSQRPLTAADDSSGPLFRSFPPSSAPDRTFPWSPTAPYLGERLPERDRDLHFRVTVRDDHRGGGGVASDDTRVRVVASAGPFRLTGPDPTLPYAGLVHLTWDVAKTDQDPIATRYVDIWASDDGGEKYSFEIVTRTPNDGAELVASPTAAGAAAAGTQTRFWVESHDGAFFAVSAEDIEILPAWATVIVVRHAEKEETGRQPLTAEGHARAAALANLLASSEIGAVWSTRTERTEDTARPTAEAFGLAVESYDDVEEIVARIHSLENDPALPAGDPRRHLLVVGHSNTVPEILRQLGVTQNVTIHHDEYDRLFVVAMTESGTVFQPFRYASKPQPRLVTVSP